MLEPLSMSRLPFEIEKEASGTAGRAARFTCLHGEVLTPIFMPVGTQATVKTQSSEALWASGSRVLLANTYHLMLRPGPEVFRRLGGIHAFMSWDGAVLTDSGGFQIFSLPNSRSMSEDGAHFQSYVDGSKHVLSPEISIEMQKAIGSDIMMVLDQCVPSTVDLKTARDAMELTHRWAKRSLNARGDSQQALFGIVQGACYPELRKESASVLREMGFDGLAIGGLAVGEEKHEREDTVESVMRYLPKDRPRYLMGVGTPLDILEAVHRGVDMFDCIIPSQIAKRGAAFTSTGRLQMRRTTYKFSSEPLDEHCVCATCRTYSRAYLHHLCKTDEVLGWKLMTVHNLNFYHRLMREIRSHLLNDTFPEYYREKREALAETDNCEPTKVQKKPTPEVAPARLGDYEVVTSTQGFSSIRQVSSGETMHPIINPMEEAKRLYLAQSGLAERLKDLSSDKELVIWDVGLGAATNAMAVVELYQSLPSPRPLKLISFECDLDPLRLALQTRDRFSHLNHEAPTAILKDKQWQSRGLEWILLEGDFLKRYAEAPKPDLIYYDPFSFKTDSALWTEPVFRDLYLFCEGKETELYTYTASTAIRAALLSAGFSVAYGFSTGPKSETTVAIRSRNVKNKDLLGGRWLDRWNRSQVKFPKGLDEEGQRLFEGRIVKHPQFSIVARD